MLSLLLGNLKVKIEEIVKDLGAEDFDVEFEIPKDKSMGDYSTNIAFKLTKVLRKNPNLIATDIVSKLNKEDYKLEKIEVLNGFINFTFLSSYIHNLVFKILSEKENYGNLKVGESEYYNVEFVSANPTGYLHIGHGRGAAYGDSLVRILKKAGYKVDSEYYINDGGGQIDNLAHSIYERYKELFGLKCELKDDYYHGPEIIEIAKMIKTKVGDEYLNKDYYLDFKKIGVDYLLAILKKDLEDFNVTFNHWFSETSLYENGDVEKTIEYLNNHKFTYLEDGALWLKSSEYGDDKDRVLVKQDGSFTYLVPDIAYHRNKLNRGYTHLVNVFGTDHHGYVPRLKAAIEMIGGNSNLLDVELLQMVRVLEDGQEIKMSKRSGKAITLRDLIDDVGSDALRYMYVSKALSTQMDLDLSLLKKNSNDNPVYYVQYAHARISSLFKTALDKGLKYQELKEFKTLDFAKSNDLVLKLLEYPEIIEDASTKRLPHRITQYAYELANYLHSYYSDVKIITDSKAESNERLNLLKAVQIVLKDALSLIGVKAKDKM
ncbi:MAG TPA: arginine--tRNA ligase [Bacilli bacterium]|nr:arginine--tRNA ligase [Bacilli bacterium]HQO93365.1 arginine--tRNA ligase [Bacilli bacterium]HQQ38838.1 arginine--tRNA ligase [Bacilli bacterium]